MNWFRLITTRKRGSKRARAGAIVEFAVVLPMLLTIVFGIIEFGWIFMVRQSVQNAAREGCRVAILQTTDAPYTEVTDRVGELLLPVGVTTQTVEMTHADGVTCQEQVTVRVPYNDVSLIGVWFGDHDYDITGRTIMRKEGCTGL